MNLFLALLLGVVEGLTEFLPVSSTGHLTILEKVLGLGIADPGVTAFTAVIQTGATLAVIVCFWRDIARLAGAWFRGLADPGERGQDYRVGWYVILGSIPIGIVGFLARDVVTGGLRNLWVVVGGLVGWSAVMWVAERRATRQRAEADLRLVDALLIGVSQCFALIPGVSRSGATISAGLLRGLDRVTATRLSFLLSIPALVAAGGYEAVSGAADIGATVGWGTTLFGTLVSFGVAWLAISWLLGLVARRPITVFVWYRLALAAVVAILLGTGVLSAT